MSLPVNPPVEPMLAKTAAKLPAADAVPAGYAYEPKWDGFRCLVFCDGDQVELGSRNTKPLTRYFPEVVAAARELLPARCVLDGELVVVQGERLEFERLLDRIHPADSRVRMLAEQTPAAFVAFDLLALGDDAYVDRPFAERRQTLEEVLADTPPPLHRTPLTTDRAVAERWFDQFEGAGLDGIVAKDRGAPYSPGARSMLKIKHVRTADVVVAGYRLHKTSTPERPLLGSLLLGLYDEAGHLQHIGVCAAFNAERRAALVEQLEPLRVEPRGAAEHPWGAELATAVDHQAGTTNEPASAGDRQASAQNEPASAGERRPGAQSRWNAGKDLSWVPLEPRLVLEVGYDHMEGTRLRHTAQFKRWRRDREPESCTYEQLAEPVSYDLRAVLGDTAH